VECRVPVETARARLTDRATDPAAVSDADWTIYQQLRAAWEPWSELPSARHQIADTSRPIDDTVAAVLAAARQLP
jgi:predicted kinase